VNSPTNKLSWNDWWAAARRCVTRVPAAVSAVLFAAPLLAHASESDRIVKALGLRPGQSVADVGAGDGDFTIPLGRAVGAAGRVFATEVEDDKLEKLRSAVSTARLAHVTVLRGDQATTGLPAGCCDAILLRLVYHHFTDPSAMRRSLWNALRPGGRLVVVETTPQKAWSALPGVPERGGHGIPAEELLDDMERDGFAVVDRYYEWPAEGDSYCVVFRRPAKASTAPASRAPATSASGWAASSSRPAARSTTRAGQPNGPRQ
jgi:ubiquinone/menaquinone biosynthesis C-methylase UbiE